MRTFSIAVAVFVAFVSAAAAETPVAFVQKALSYLDDYTTRVCEQQPVPFACKARVQRARSFVLEAHREIGNAAIAIVGKNAKAEADARWQYNVSLLSLSDEIEKLVEKYGK